MRNLSNITRSLRYALILRLAGSDQVIINCKVVIPPTLGKPGVLLNETALASLESIIVSAEAWENAKAVISPA